MAAFNTLPPLVEIGMDKIPYIPEGSPLYRKIDTGGFALYHELIESNLLAYAIGEDFSELNATQKNRVFELYKEGNPELTNLLMLPLADGFTRDDDKVVPFSKTEFSLKKAFKKGPFRTEKRERNFYPINGYSGTFGGKRIRRVTAESDLPGFVSLNRKQLVLTIVLRGTLMNANDWATNGAADRIAGKGLVSRDFEGTIHAGFGRKVKYLKKSLNSILKKIFEELSIDQKSEMRIFVTGHSQGGALALLTGAWLASRLWKGKYPEMPYDENRVQIFQFSPARVLGDEAAVKYLEKRVGKKNVIRLINKGDIVPYLPPHFFEFGHTAYDVPKESDLVSYAAGLSDRCQDTYEQVKGIGMGVAAAHNHYKNNEPFGMVSALCNALWKVKDTIIGGLVSAGDKVEEYVVKKCKGFFKAEGGELLMHEITTRHSLQMRRHYYALTTPFTINKVNSAHPDLNLLFAKAMGKVPSAPVERITQAWYAPAPVLRPEPLAAPVVQREILHREEVLPYIYLLNKYCEFEVIYKLYACQRRLWLGKVLRQPHHKHLDTAALKCGTFFAYNLRTLGIDKLSEVLQIIEAIPKHILDRIKKAEKNSPFLQGHTGGNDIRFATFEIKQAPENDPIGFEFPTQSVFSMTRENRIQFYELIDNLASQIKMEIYIYRRWMEWHPKLTLEMFSIPEGATDRIHLLISDDGRYDFLSIRSEKYLWSHSNKDYEITGDEIADIYGT